MAQSGKSSSGVWASTTLINSNSLYSFTIPSGLKPGYYIIRCVHTPAYLDESQTHNVPLISHEIIALHAAYTYPGAQVYPSCSQVQITGSGTRYPTSFVSFPGAYTGTTPGIVYDVYTNTSAYPIPGPALYVLSILRSDVGFLIHISGGRNLTAENKASRRRGDYYDVVSGFIGLK